MTFIHDLATTEHHRWHEGREYDALAAGVQRRNARLLLSLYPHNSGAPERVLEIGPGTGFLTEQLVYRWPQSVITAVDPSSSMLDVATAKPMLQNVAFVHGSFPGDLGGTWDALFSNAALHWLFPHYRSTFSRAWDLLAPGGRFVAATAGRTHGTDHFDQLVCKALGERPAFDVPFADRRLDPAALTEIVSSVGFVVEDAFLVERHVPISCEAYVRWWLASGGPLSGKAELVREELVAAVTATSSDDGHNMTLIHGSLFFVLRRETLPE